MNRTEVKGINHDNFERGWALLTEDGKVKNVCANCGEFHICKDIPWDREPCPKQVLLEKARW